MKTIKELIEYVKTGARPVIQFNEKHQDYDADPGFRGHVVGFEYEDKYDDGQVVIIKVSLKEFEDYNKLLALPNWNDGEGNYTKTWFDSGVYPSSGKYQVYVMEEQTCEEAGFIVIEDSGLFQRYKEEKPSITYVQWLEQGWIKNNL